MSDEYECLRDPACREWWDGYYAPSHSARCAESNRKRVEKEEATDG